MSPRQTPPFRVEHVGSLLRPDYLLETRKKFDKKEITEGQLREIEDRAIVEAIKLQREAGIKSITDGEYRRHMFFDGFFEFLEGFEVIHNPPLEIFKVLPHLLQMDNTLIKPQLYVPDIHGFVAQNTKPAATMLCTSKIRHVKSGYLPQFEALKALVQPDEVKHIKITMAPPEWFHLRHGEHAFSPQVYADREGYFNDIAAAYRKELDILYTAGCRNVQIDDAHLTFFCDVSMIKGMRGEGGDPDALFDAYIRLLNNCLATRQPDMTIGIHLCRGNFRHSIHFAEGGYEAIVPKLFNEVDVDCYYLEYDTERAGTFEPLKYLPKHKTVVLGLVTSKFPELEDKEVLRERVFEAARVMARATGETEEEALQRICVSPQCGFASHEEGNLLSAEDMKRKLHLVKSLAESIWTDV